MCIGRPCFKVDLLVTVSQAHHPVILKQHLLSLPLSLLLSVSITITPATLFIHPTSVCLALISALTPVH